MKVDLCIAWDIALLLHFLYWTLIRCDLLIIFIIKATRAALAAEESKIERLKAQLKELLRFSQDVQPHAESVVSAIHQYQRYWEVWLWWAGGGNRWEIVRVLRKK